MDKMDGMDGGVRCVHSVHRVHSLGLPGYVLGTEADEEVLQDEAGVGGAGLGVQVGLEE